MFLLTIPSFATDITDTTNDTFVEEDISTAIKLANERPVVADKGATGRSSSGTYPTRKGVILVTPNNESLGGKTFVGHSAIVYSSSYVVESLRKGVTLGKNDWKQSKSVCYAVTVHGTSVKQDAAAADYCYSKLGLDYNWIFTNIDTRKKFYCSQLIWASYKDMHGIDLNTSEYGEIIAPMELVNNDKTYIVYKKTGD